MPLPISLGPLTAGGGMSNADNSTTIITPTTNQSGGSQTVQNDTRSMLADWLPGSGSSYAPLFVLAVVALIAFFILRRK